MVADTYSNRLGWYVMGTGNDNNAWGDDCNQKIFTVFEDAICGVLSSTVAGGSLDLSGNAPPLGPSQARFAMLKFDGALTATQTVTVPNAAKIYRVFNGCTGSFGLLFKCAGGTVHNAPSGKWTTFFCDGAGNCFRDDLDDVGTSVDSASDTQPLGTVPCDGTIYQVADAPDLFAKISNLYGGNGTTTFAVPNMTDTGRFKRSKSGSLTVGTYQANQLPSHTHTASATTTASTDLQGLHTHSTTSTVTDPGHFHTFTVPIDGGNFVALVQFTSNYMVQFNQYTTSRSTSGVTVATSITAAGAHSHTVTASTSVTLDPAGSGSESLPETIVMKSYIRY